MSKTLDNLGLAKPLYPMTGENKLDLTKLPDFAGVIVNDILDFQIVPQPRLACVGALHLLSLSSPWTTSPRGFKTNLISITVGLSASGKDSHQEYLDLASGDAGFGKHVIGDMRSDKDLISNLLNNENITLYKMDEVHGFFGSINSKNASSYQKNMTASILQLYSTRVLKLSGIIRRELEQERQKEVQRKCRELANQGVENDDAINSEIENINSKYRDIENFGIRDPYFSLMGSSTPLHMDSFISDDNLADGMLGRVIFIRGEDERPKVDFYAKKTGGVNLSIINKLREINQRKHPFVKFDNDAEFAMMAVHEWTQQDEVRNNEDFGAIYMRFGEQVEKVASILAIGNNFRMTKEHVEWAYKFVYMSISDVISTYRSNVTKVGTPEELEDSWNKTLNAICMMFDNGNSYVTPGAFKQRLFRVSKKKFPLREKIELIARAENRPVEQIQADFVKYVLSSDWRSESGTTVIKEIEKGKFAIHDAHFLKSQPMPAWYRQFNYVNMGGF